MKQQSVSPIIIEKIRPRAPVFFQIHFMFMLCLLFLPIIVMLVGAWLEKEGEKFVLSLHWFQEVWRDAELLAAMYRSLWVGVISGLSATIIGTALAIALVRNKFYGKNFLQFLSSVSLAMPELVFALALLSWFVFLGFQLSLLTVIFSHITFCLAYVVVTISARLFAMDESIEDAARDLGANEWEVLYLILLPLLKPAIISSFLLSLLVSFDDFLVTYYLAGAGNDTLPIKLYTSMRTGLTPKLNALASLMFFFCLGIGFLYYFFLYGNRRYRWK